MTKRFGDFVALDAGFAQGGGGQLPRAAGRERRRQEHAGQVHHGLLSARPGRRHRRRKRADDRQSARRPRARARHGLSALHAGGRHDGDRESGAGARPPARRHRLAGGDQGARSVSRPHAVSHPARRQGVGPLGRRAAEMRDPQAALSRAALPHSGRADLGAHAGRSRRGARHAARHGQAGRAHDPDDHPQVPRGDGVRRRGHDPAAGQARRARPRRRPHPRRHGPHHDRGRAIDRAAGALRRLRASHGSRSAASTRSTTAASRRCATFRSRIRAGEIVGIAGVSGNGQRQLVEVLAGQREAEAGQIHIGGEPYHARPRGDAPPQGLVPAGGAAEERLRGAHERRRQSGVPRLRPAAVRARRAGGSIDPPSASGRRARSSATRSRPAAPIPRSASSRAATFSARCWRASSVARSTS